MMHSIEKEFAQAIEEYRYAVQLEEKALSLSLESDDPRVASIVQFSSSIFSSSMEEFNTVSLEETVKLKRRGLMDVLRRWGLRIKEAFLSITNSIQYARETLDKVIETYSKNGAIAGTITLTKRQPYDPNLPKPPGIQISVALQTLMVGGYDLNVRRIASRVAAFMDSIEEAKETFNRLAVSHSITESEFVETMESLPLVGTVIAGLTILCKDGRLQWGDRERDLPRQRIGRTRNQFTLTDEDIPVMLQELKKAGELFAHYASNKSNETDVFEKTVKGNSHINSNAAMMSLLIHNRDFLSRYMVVQLYQSWYTVVRLLRSDFIL